MTPGDVVFFVANLIIVLGYTTVAAYFAVVELEDGGIRKGQKRAAMAFFFLCASTHVELAVHGLAGTNIVAPDVAWHMVVIHVPQALSIVAMILYTARYGIVLPPIERRKQPEPKPKPGGDRSYDP